jgi:CheY-like chemotaxis protein/curved DNA-binding protein CbpA
MAARIVLAEDNDSLSQMLQKFLAAQGYEVLPARTGVEALQRLTAGNVDLLLLDLRLPELSGVDVLQKIRKSPKLATLPVVIMTGVYKGEKFVAAARKLGVTRYLEKPFSQKDFLMAVKESLAADTAAPQQQEQPQPVPILERIVDIYSNRRSGILTFGDGAPVVFLRGEPVSFVSRGRDEFPAYLHSQGKIAPNDRQTFVAAKEERLFFTQAGLLTYDELTEESRNFLYKRLANGLEKRTPSLFKEGGVEPEFPLVPMSVPRIVYEIGKSQVNQFNTIAFMARYGELYPARTARFFRYVNLVAMRQEDIDLLERINGSTRLTDLITQTETQQIGAAFCHFLMLLGMLAFNRAPTAEATPDFAQQNLFNRPLEELHHVEEKNIDFEDIVSEVSSTVGLPVGDEGMAAPLSSAEIGFEQEVHRDFAYIKNKNYYELFGLTPQTFSFNALKEAYFAKTRQYSPEKFMELAGPVMAQAQDVLAHYADAYNTLSNVVSKERYDEILNSDMVGLDGKQDDKLQASVQFQSGNVFLEMGEFENAEKALQDAYRLEPDNGLHSACLAWAIYKNPANKNSKAAQDKARTLLAKSLQSGKHAEAFAFRGWMLLDEGRDGLAEGEFQKALKINPKESNARKGMRLIAERREADNKGFFKKIFG